jgi:hypothetical protein
MKNPWQPMIKLSAFLDRTGAIALVLYVICALIVVGVGLAYGAETDSRSFWDRNGSFACSAGTQGNYTTFTDGNGNREDAQFACRHAKLRRSPTHPEQGDAGIDRFGLFAGLTASTQMKQSI